MTNILEDKEDIVKQLKVPFEDVSYEIGEALDEFLEHIDDYGKLPAIFIIIIRMIISIIFASLITFIL